MPRPASLLPVLAALLAGCGSADPIADLEDVVPPDCQLDADCGDGEACWINPIANTSSCVPACEVDADCDGDLVCRTMFETRACVEPLEEAPPPPPERDDNPGLPQAPGDVACADGPVNGTIDIPFQVAAGTRSTMIVPFSTDGGPVRPRSWELPDGSIVFDNGQAGFLGVTSSLLGNTAPLFLPQSPILEELLVPGTHVYSVDADTDQLCAYIVSEDATVGTELDLNLHFVGLGDLDAASAAGDDDLLLALQTLDEIYADAGITVGNIRVNDAPAAVADEFAIIDERAQLDALMATSEPPGPSDDELLSVNVFLVAAIDIENSGVIGISQGLPGPAGLHGSTGSGVVLTSEFLRLGSANNPALGAELTGVVMAHEIGHWLGLFHTSELAGGVQDPIQDTPGCDGIAQLLDAGNLGACPDVDNLMFPVASATARTLTPQQGGVLVANPVTR